jgi:hypothetical protein
MASILALLVGKNQLLSIVAPSFILMELGGENELEKSAVTPNEARSELSVLLKIVIFCECKEASRGEPQCT